MGLLQAINGLNAAKTEMDIISDNIANAYTIGFKSKNIVLSDLNKKNNAINDVKGMGVNILKIKSNTNAGEIIDTNRNLDLSINKNGFFRLSTKNGSIYYTRNGRFYIDKYNQIVNEEGMYLTGYLINYSSSKSNSVDYKLMPINLSNYKKTTSQPTSILKFFITLNSHDHIKIDREFNKNIATTYNYKLKIKIINSLGKEKFIHFYFIKTANKIWHIHTFNSIENKKIIPFKIEFNSNGNIISKKKITIDIEANKDKKKGKILLDLEKIFQKKIISKKNYFSQNGYPEGIIQSYEIDKDGTINGLYSNQKKIPLSKIILSNFTNNENLKHEGNSIWSKTNYSGIETIGIPGSIGFGFLISGSLEKSNVNLNKEFINMIKAQRHYQANAQVVKVEEKMFNTLINL